MTQRMQGKVVLVMGAGSVTAASSTRGTDAESGAGFVGNGRASAIVYAREGAAMVVCVDIVRAAAEETVRMIVAEGGRAEVQQADVTNASQVEALVADLIARHGCIDVLHNNVGITAMGGPVEESLESWHHVMDTNVSAMFIAAKYVIPHMLKAGRGAIVNISSLAGIRVTPYPYTSYYASKAAVVHLTTHLGLQYAKQGIRANSIAPGLMNTPMVHQQIAGQYPSIDAMEAARDAMSPTGKMGDGWDIAHAAVFLASDDAKFINGIVLPVDGGQHALMR